MTVTEEKATWSMLVLDIFIENVTKENTCAINTDDQRLWNTSWHKGDWSYIN